MRGQMTVGVLLLWGLLLVPRPGDAQSITSGSIAGVVRDTTAAVLPGVTVEAASDALIEKVRAVVTDDQGQYRIIDLRPGTYTVTFRLTGFSAVKREGVALTTGFTATVNAELAVGSLEETITVSTETPVVDIQNVRSQTVLPQQVLDAVPTGKTISGYATLLVGAVLPPGAQDVGGNRGEVSTSFAIHGGRASDLKLMLDGMGFNSLQGTGGGGSRNFVVNQVSTEEITLQTGGMSAESETGGVQLNAVPKEGGNTFSVYSLVNYTNGDLQASNLTDALIARGFTTETPVEKVYDYGFGLGGPIKRNSLWFYTGHRWWGAQQPIGGLSGGFFNATQDTWFYTPDLSKPAHRDNYVRDNNIRVTWQIGKQKLSVADYNQHACNCYGLLAPGRSPEAAQRFFWNPDNVSQAVWTYPATSRLLLQAGASYHVVNNNVKPAPNVRPEDIAVLELSTGLRYKARGELDSTAYGVRSTALAQQRFSVSYVTGSHGLKVGFLIQEGKQDSPREIHQAVMYTFNLGRPTSVTQFATPYLSRFKLMPNLGVYAQDQWTVQKLTLNVGLRVDYLRGYVPETNLDAGRFVPARNFARVDDVPNWKDFSPRLGAAYDLFGDGKTALKASLGKYLAGEASSAAELNSPVNATVSSATRTWDDANRDYVPQESELGPLSNANFGRTIITTRSSPDVITGWGVRGFNWEGSASLQHELRPGIALNVAYFRRWYGNFTVTDNLELAPSDFDPFCVTAPADQRLPGGGGNRICGFYDISPAKFGRTNNLISQASNFGEQTEVFNGVDVTVNARFGGAGLLSGGVSTGRTVTDNCSVVVDSPQKQFCRDTVPFSGQTQLKFNGIYPLPWNLQASATFQSLPGIPISASHVVGNAAIIPSLGRNLGACGSRPVCTSTVTIELMEPNTRFEGRINQVDVRLTRNFRVARARLQGMFDLYNVLNASPVLAMTTRYGSAWLQPNQILGARLFKFGIKVEL